MSSEPQLDETKVTTRHIHVDFNSLREVAYLGVRRAVAFLSIGLVTTEEYVPTSFVLEKQSMWRFFPEPLPAGAGEGAVQEFRDWVTGNALRELDLRFGLFLDQTSWFVRLSKLHRKRVRTTHVVRTIAGETNVAKKFETVMKELGEESPDAAMLRSLSNARNCLSHNAGIVGPRHANVDNALEIRWQGLQAQLTEENKQTVLPPTFEPIYVPAGGTIELVITERRKRFDLGQRISLTPNDLHEICFYYLRLTDAIIEKFAADTAARGIGVVEPTAQI